MGGSNLTHAHSKLFNLHVFYLNKYGTGCFLFLPTSTVEHVDVVQVQFREPSSLSQSVQGDVVVHGLNGRLSSVSGECIRLIVHDGVIVIGYALCSRMLLPLEIVLKTCTQNKEMH